MTKAITIAGIAAGRSLSYAGDVLRAVGTKLVLRYEARLSDVYSLEPMRWSAAREEAIAEARREAEARLESAG